MDTPTRSLSKRSSLAQMRDSQKRAGLWSALFFMLALLALLDGLQAIVRGDAYQLDMLPGMSESISGPCPAATPTESDLVVEIYPSDAPLHFDFEGFFASYWIGTGMWRATIHTSQEAYRSHSTVQVSFKNSTVTKPLEFKIQIWEDRAALQAGALSWIKKLTGQNPFFMALVLGLAGSLCGIANFRLSRRVQTEYRRMGYSEIFRIKTGYKAEDPTMIWSLPFIDAPRPGEMFEITDAHGEHMGEARVRQQHKTALELRLICGEGITPGCMVRRKFSRASDQEDRELREAYE